jgi:hypothetical protein
VSPAVFRPLSISKSRPVFIIEKAQQAKNRKAAPEVRQYTLRRFFAPISYGVVSRSDP